MAFETLGIELITRGVSNFTRDLSHIAGAMVGYSRAVSSMERSMTSASKAEYKAALQRNNIAKKSLETAAKTYAEFVILQNKYAQAMTAPRRGGGGATYAERLANPQNFSPGLVAIAQKAQDKWNKSILDSVDALETFRFAQASANISLIDSKDKFQKLFAVMKMFQGAGGGLKQFFSILTGGFGKSAAEGLGLVKVLGLTQPQIAALVLGLDVLALGFNAVVFVTKIFVGALKLVGGIVVSVIKWIGDLAVEIGKRLLKAIVDVAKAPFAWIKKGFDSIWQSLKRIAEIAIGMNLERMLFSISAKMRDLADVAFEGATQFQLLNVRLDGLVARESLVSGESKTFTEALDRTAGKSKELLDWMIKLAVQSPFSNEQISNSFALAMSYGFAANEAQALIVATVNFAAGMGLTDQAISRIIENIGQMKAAGKLMGTELRDLARGAFVPINAVLEEVGKTVGLTAAELEDITFEELGLRSGKTAIEVRKLGTEGKIGAEEFAAAFERVVARDFPEAAARLSSTFEVAKSNVIDFIQTMIGMKVIMPTLNIVSERLNMFVQSMFTNKNIKRFDGVGRAISVVADSLIKFGNVLKSGFSSIKLPALIKDIDTFFEILGSGNFVIDESGKTFTNFFNSVKDQYDKKFGVDSGFLAFDFSKMEKLAGIADAIVNAIAIGDWSKIKTILTSVYNDYIKPWVDETVIPKFNELKLKALALVTEGFQKILDWCTTELPRIVLAWANSENGLPKIKSAMTDLSDYVKDGLLRSFQNLYDWVVTNTGEGSPFSAFAALLYSIVNSMGNLGNLIPSNIGGTKGSGALTQSGRPDTSQGSILAPLNTGRPDMSQPKSLAGLPVSTALDDMNKSIVNLVNDGLKQLGDWITTNAPWLYVVGGALMLINSGFISIAEGMKPAIDAMKELEEKTGVISGALKLLGLILGLGILGALVVFGLAVKWVGIAIENLLIFITGLINGFKDAWLWITMVRDLFIQVGDDFKSGKIGQGFLDFGIAIFALVTTPLMLVLAFISNFVNSVILYFTNLYDELVGQSIIPEMMLAIYTSIVTWFTLAYDWLGEKVSGIADMFSTDTLSSAGTNLIQGLWNGMAEVWNKLLIWWETIVAPKLSDIWAKLNKENSPSKVFEKHGIGIMEGLALGIAKGANLAEMSLLRSAVSLQSIPLRTAQTYITNSSTSNFVGNNFNVGSGQNLSQFLGSTVGA